MQNSVCFELARMRSALQRKGNRRAIVLRIARVWNSYSDVIASFDDLLVGGAIHGCVVERCEEHASGEENTEKASQRNRSNPLAVHFTERAR